MPGQSHPVIVSIATIPSRIKHLKPTLESLMAGTLTPDLILVNHPEYCEWESSGYDIPDFLCDKDFCGNLIKVNRISEDWGPGTKLIGALDHLPEQSYLVVADDDVVYHEDFLKGLIEKQSKNKNSSFSFYTYRANGLKSGQGCDGYSFWSPNLKGIKSLAENLVRNTTLLYHDDLWISYFLYLHNVDVRRVNPPDNNALVYTQVLPNNVLSSQTSGRLSREEILNEALPRLIRETDLKTSKRFKLQFYKTIDRIVAKIRWIFNRRKIS